MRNSRSDMEDVSSPIKVTPTAINRKETLSPQVSLSKQSVSTEWTDEKHTLYLKSMEATFVNQLYTSLARHTQKQQHSKPSRQMHAGARVPSGQFKVVQGGCWKMINFKKSESQVDKTGGDSCSLSTNQWIRRYRTGCINQTVTSPIFPAFKNHATYSKEPSAATDTKQLYMYKSQLSLHEPVDSSAEMSGQNFVDEDIEDDKAKARYSHSAKRMKTSGVAPSRCDQVMSGVAVSTRP